MKSNRRSTLLSILVFLSLVAGASHARAAEVLAPTFDPPKGTYIGEQTITIATATPGAQLRYTLDGSIPSYANGTLIPATSGTVTLTVSKTVKAVAFLDAQSVSPVAGGYYLIRRQVEQPTLSQVAGTYIDSVTVDIASTTWNAQLRYTTDGSVPTATHGTLIADKRGTVTLASTATLKVVAFREGWVTSELSGGFFRILRKVERPTVSVAPGTYVSPLSIDIASTTWNAQLRYTTDGSVPTATHGTLIAARSGTVTLAATATLKVVAFRDGWATSDISGGLYRVQRQVETPVLSVEGGTYVGPLSVDVASATWNAQLRYTTDGSAPTATHGTLIPAKSGTVTLASSATLKVVAFRDGWVDSPVSGAYYVLQRQVERPTLSLAAGNYYANQRVEIGSSTWNAQLRYTLDGSLPTATHGILVPAPSGVVDITATATLKVVAFREGWASSEVSGAFYRLLGQTRWYEDNDGDSYTTGVSVLSYDQPQGYVMDYQLLDLTTLDCDDANYDVNPGAAEILDQLDNNCDGRINEGFALVWGAGRWGQGEWR